MRNTIKLKHRSYQLVGIYFLTVLIGIAYFDPAKAAIGVWIITVVEYLAQAILHVERPLRELADFANESKREI